MELRHSRYCVVEAPKTIAAKWRGSSMDGLRRLVLLGQSGFYIVMGLWPIISMSSFEAVTGPKTDDWLVQTVGLLATAIGVSLLVGVWRSHPSRETLTLSVTAAAAFACVDAVFVLRRVISSIYLVDAAIEGMVLLSLAATSRARRPSGQSPPSSRVG
jgi:energy-converting hydrogenase Eha subunit E